MNHHQAFLQAIRDDPGDNTPRLIYADYLAESGDEDRAEVIRIQCTLPQLRQDRGQSLELLRRLRELTQGRRLDWLGILTTVAPDSVFERGFVEEIHTTGKLFHTHAQAIFDRHPITRIVLEQSARLLPELGDCPFLEGLRVLNLRANELNDREFCQLLKSPHLSRLQTLIVEENRLTTRSAKALFNCRGLPNLEVLHLARNRLSNEGMQALAKAKGLAKLRLLDLAQNGISNLGAQSLAEAAWLGNLDCLRVAGNRLTAPGIEQLAESPLLANVKSIDASAHRLDPEVTRRLRTRFGPRVQVWL